MTELEILSGFEFNSQNGMCLYYNYHYGKDNFRIESKGGSMEIKFSEVDTLIKMLQMIPKEFKQ